MSLDISITNKKTGDVREMNWLRNPFGLCNWAEDNLNFIIKDEPKEEDSLYYVVNHWNYKKGSKVNRVKFREVVLWYWQILEDLKEGYFFLDAVGIMDYVMSKSHLFPMSHSFGSPRIEKAVYHDRTIGIPMEYFDNIAFDLSNSSLEGYKEWFSQLVEFAELLQNKDYKFYCSN